MPSAIAPPKGAIWGAGQSKVTGAVRNQSRGRGRERERAQQPCRARTGTRCRDDRQHLSRNQQSATTLADRRGCTGITGIIAASILLSRAQPDSKGRPARDGRLRPRAREVFVMGQDGETRARKSASEKQIVCFGRNLLYLGGGFVRQRGAFTL